ncbi:MAG TPA: YezD family protein [Methylococcus sp.]|nr:YezD family protein [Methylococcus sp.]
MTHARQDIAQPASALAQAHGLVQQVLNALAELRYGSIEITVHDGRVVQIERREKIRPSLSN